tara:strand:- start:408 stop:1700 length:1293 start_codon:yes stop_codon:yes gene_type:complete
MAKKTKEEVVENTTEEKVESTEEKVETKKSDDKIRIKKPKFSKNTDEVIKVDLRNVNKSEEEVITKEEEKVEKEDAVQESKTEELSVGDKSTTSETVGEQDSQSEDRQENKEQVPENEQESVLEEITEEEVVEKKTEELIEEVKEAVEEQKETGVELPENIQKVVDFMNDTGGSLEEYVRLNQDYTSLDDRQLLREFYRSTKPHLSSDEIDFLMEDSFSYDEEVDEQRDIKRKKLALKEQVASAKSHLDGLKSKYYEEIKAGSKLTSEQQKAVDFFNRYNKESDEKSKIAERQKLTFNKKTNEVFSNEFKGFEYKVGDKRYRFNVKEADKVKQTQSDINNFVRKFLNENNEMVDAKGYHKSLFTAMNSDAIANHFYEQGKADAIKESVARAKNIDMNPRQGHEGFVDAGGIKVRALTGDNSSDFKFKIKK